MADSQPETGALAPASSPLLLTTNEEDFNIPNPQRLILLQRLQMLLGRENLPIQFVAASFICDVHELENTINLAAIRRLSVLSVAHQSSDMIRICKLNKFLQLLNYS